MFVYVYEIICYTIQELWICQNSKERIKNIEYNLIQFFIYIYIKIMTCKIKVLKVYYTYSIIFIYEINKKSTSSYVYYGL